MRTLTLVVFGGLVVAACTPLAEPIVTDYNGYSVKVFEAGNKRFPATEILAKAQSACQIDGQTAVYQSTNVESDGDWLLPDQTHFFLCR